MSERSELSDSDEYTDAHEDPPDHSDESSDDSEWERWSKRMPTSTGTSFNTTAPYAPPTDMAGDKFAAEDAAPQNDLTLTDEESRRKEEAKLTEDELERRKIKSLESKERGNELFRNALYIESLEEYTKSLDVCPLIYEKERSVLFSNRAACHHKLNNIDAALSDCDKALSLQPDYVKCLQRRATLREERDMLTDALNDYEKLLQLDPGNEKARWACLTLPDRIKKQQEEMKEKMLDQLKLLGNMVLKPFGLSTDNFKLEKKPDSEGYSINFVR